MFNKFGPFVLITRRPCAKTTRQPCRIFYIKEIFNSVTFRKTVSPTGMASEIHLESFLFMTDGCELREINYWATIAVNTRTLCIMGGSRSRCSGVGGVSTDCCE